MLVEFKVGNYLSIKDLVTFSMVASADRAHGDTNTIFLDKKLRLLKSAVLYGANASGKSNVFRAMDFMKNFVINSSRDSQSGDPIPVEVFRLCVEKAEEPASFEIIFIIEGNRYRYGFQVDHRRIHGEWLYYTPSIREAMLFQRENGVIRVGSHFKEGKGLEGKTRDNALFLSVAAQFNGEVSRSIVNWFKDFYVVMGMKRMAETRLTAEKLDLKDFKEFTLKLLKVADTGIVDVKKEMRPIIGSDTIKVAEISTYHQRFDRSRRLVDNKPFLLLSSESTGTQSLFAISFPVYDTLKNNKVLVIDELTSTLHPLLTRALIGLFHARSPEGQGEAQSSQLVFASHDTSVLSNQFFRRDQVWFTQKDEYGATDLYSLEEYRVRKDASFHKDYITGKYGAIPFIGDIDALF